MSAYQHKKSSLLCDASVPRSSLELADQSHTANFQLTPPVTPSGEQVGSTTHKVFVWAAVTSLDPHTGATLGWAYNLSGLVPPLMTLHRLEA